jgi:hypothetical protein
VLDPAVIVTLGRYSLGTFMPGARISAAHGTTRPVDPATGAPNAVTYAMYHPAAAFRQAALKETLFAEMANLPQVLLDTRAARRDGAMQPAPHTEHGGSLPVVEAFDLDAAVPIAPGPDPAVPEGPAPLEPAASLAPVPPPVAGSRTPDAPEPVALPGPDAAPAALAADPWSVPVDVVDAPLPPLDESDSAPLPPEHAAFDPNQMTIF